MNFIVIDEYLIESALTQEEKKAYEHYLNLRSERTEWEELRSKVNSHCMSLPWYKEECAKLAKRVKYMTFESQQGTKGKFRMRPIIDGKRISLGMSESFDEACTFLGQYLKAKVELMNS